MVHGVVENIESVGSSLIVSFISPVTLGKQIAFRANIPFLFSHHYFSEFVSYVNFLGTRYVFLSKLLTLVEQDTNKRTALEALCDIHPTVNRWTPAIDQHHLTIVFFDIV